MTITDAWIAVGIFIIIFEVLFLILHCIFSAEYHRDIKKIDELGKKEEKTEAQICDEDGDWYNVKIAELIH